LIFGQAIQSQFSNKHWARTLTTSLITKKFKYTKLDSIEIQRIYVTAFKTKTAIKTPIYTQIGKRL